MITVGIIDDDPSSRALLQMLLQREGYKVVTANTGVEGLQIVHSYHPDVILVDDTLPGINSDEVCRRIRSEADANDIYIVLYGGHDNLRDPSYAKLLGVDMVLVRPFPNQQIINILKRLPGKVI